MRICTTIEYTFFRCFVCNFAFVVDLDVNLLEMQINVYKANGTVDPTPFWVLIVFWGEGGIFTMLKGVSNRSCRCEAGGFYGDEDSSHCLQAYDAV